MRNRFVRGTHNAISDDSGFKFKRRDMKFDWRGFLVQRYEWSEKHTQLTIRGRKENIAGTDGTRTQADDLPLLDPPFVAGS